MSIVADSAGRARTLWKVLGRIADGRLEADDTLILTLEKVAKRLDEDLNKLAGE